MVRLHREMCQLHCACATCWPQDVREQQQPGDQMPRCPWGVNCPPFVAYMSAAPHYLLAALCNVSAAPSSVSAAPHYVLAAPRCVSRTTLRVGVQREGATTALPSLCGLRVGHTKLCVGCTMLRVGCTTLCVSHTTLCVSHTTLHVGRTMLCVGCTMLNVSYTMLRVGCVT